jgi:hypothetical protein
MGPAVARNADTKAPEPRDRARCFASPPHKEPGSVQYDGTRPAWRNLSKIFLYVKSLTKESDYLHPKFNLPV